MADADTITIESLEKMRVVDLKERLSALGLTTSGKQNGYELLYSNLVTRCFNIPAEST